MSSNDLKVEYITRCEVQVNMMSTDLPSSSLGFEGYARAELDCKDVHD